MPRFSVITPSYNQAQFIGATIASVLSQEVDLDYWIIDGGSTDGTVSILQAQTDPRLRWLSERDRGQADAINKGLARASGDLLTFINSDDILLPGALKFAVDYFDTHPRRRPDLRRCPADRRGGRPALALTQHPLQPARRRHRGHDRHAAGIGLAAARHRAHRRPGRTAALCPRC